MSERETVVEGIRAAPRTPAALGDRFHHVREIARGGMGRVVEAVDVQLQRTVAIKQMLASHPDARRRFEREVEITARLEHPSIVPVYDASTDGAEPFYVMRKLSGHPLDRLVRDAATLDQRLTLLPNVLAMADAVAHAHARGVVHRDLKPSNVLVGDLGETVVIDWGLAKLVGEPEPPAVGAAEREPLHTAVGAVVGTPGFMAPEQARGDAIDVRADVYALGACLYYVLAGRPPFHGSSASHVIAEAATARPPPLAAIVPGVPHDLVTIVETAMAREPAKRYLDAGGLSEELRRFLAGQLVASHRYSVRARVVRWLRRHRAAMIAIGAASVVLAVFGVASLRRIVAESARAESALARERERTDELVIAQASYHTEGDPTLAIAWLQQLRADSPRWATLGATIAAARAGGIAYGFPGEGGSRSWVSISDDALAPRLIAVGNGTLRIHDLGARTTHVLREGLSARAYAAWVGSWVLLSDRDRPLELIDPVTRVATPIAWPRDIVTTETGGGVLVFLDADRRVGWLDPRRGGPPAELANAARSIRLSPSGRWLAVGDDTRTRLLRRSVTGWELVRELDFEASSIAFDAGERRFAAGRGSNLVRDVVELDLERGAVERRTWPAQSVIELVYADALYGAYLEPYEVRRLDDGGATAVVATYDRSPIRAMTAMRGALVVREGLRRIAIVRGTSRHVVRAPLDLEAVVAVPGRAIVVGVSSAQLLAWDLEAIVPPAFAAPVGANLMFVGSGHLFALANVTSELVDTGKVGRPFRWYRFDGETVEDRGGGTIPLVAYASVIGDDVVAHDPVFDVVRVIDPDLAIAVPDVVKVEAIDRDVLVAGTRSGAVHLVDRKTGASKAALVELGTRIAGIATRGGWIAVQAIDGTLWRRDPRGSAAQLRLEPAALGLGVVSDGTVYLTRGDELIEWPLDGAPREVARLAQGIQLELAVADRVIAATRGGALYVYERATRRAQLVLSASDRHAIAAGGTLAAAVVDGAVVGIDLRTGQTWRVIEQLDVEGLAVSPDGKTIVASEPSRAGSTLHVRTIELPGDPAAWVRAATNAVPPASPRGTVQWRMP